VKCVAVSAGHDKAFGMIDGGREGGNDLEIRGSRYRKLWQEPYV
jgi:hypothetical protein